MWSFGTGFFHQFSRFTHLVSMDQGFISLLPNIISLYRYMTFYLPIEDEWLFGCFLAIINNAATSIHVQVFMLT